MSLCFITGSDGKFAEFKAHLPQLRHLRMDLPEIQSLDPKEIIRAKVNEARRNHSDDLLVEDTSLYMSCLNGLPGPLIKWFLMALGDNGIYKLAMRHHDAEAVAKTVIGYAHGTQVEFFEGEIRGKITAPRGSDKFGWDTIFVPTGHNETFAELGSNVKNTISHRHKALVKLISALKRNESTWMSLSAK